MKDCIYKLYPLQFETGHINIFPDEVLALSVTKSSNWASVTGLFIDLNVTSKLQLQTSIVQRQRLHIGILSNTV